MSAVTDCSTELAKSELHADTGSNRI